MSKNTIPLFYFCLWRPISSSWGVFHDRSGVFLIKSLSNWSPNMLMPGKKLLKGGFITEQDLAPVINCPVKILLANSILFFFIVGVNFVFLQAYKTLIQILWLVGKKWC